MNKAIGIIGMGAIGEISTAARHLERILISNFQTAEGKLIIVHPSKEDFGDLIEKMKEINPNLTIVFQDHNQGDPDLIFEDHAKKVEMFEIKNFHEYKDLVVQVDPKFESQGFQSVHEFKRDQRFRSNRHNFNPKNYRR